MNRPLVIVEPKTHRRLRLVDALREHHDIHPVPSIDSALRTIRSLRPSIVLIGVGRRTAPALRLARQIQTDGSTPAMVALIDWNGRINTPNDTANACGAVGIYTGTPLPDSIRSFVQELRPETVQVEGEAPRSTWNRLLKR